VLLSCSASKKTINKKTLNQAQVFLVSQSEGLPGKCYSKLLTQDGTARWTEIYCEQEITKSLIKIVQTNLTRLGYNVDTIEMESNTLGDTTRSSFVQFQKDHGMAFGGLDQATLFKLLNTKK